jgi:hypothetical protein
VTTSTISASGGIFAEYSSLSSAAASAPVPTTLSTQRVRHALRSFVGTNC